MLDASFTKHFSKLEDPRVTNHNTRHKFIDILVLAFIGNLCGCDDWAEVEEFCNRKKRMFDGVLELPHGIPSHDTFGRVFSMIDSYHFEEIFIEWMSEIFVKTEGEIIAIDGKTIRAARNKGELKGIHLVNAWACKNKLTLGAMRVDSKTNEITVIPRLLKLLDISNCTVTLDAMGCQRNIAKEIIKNKANYVLTVKNNQADLRCSLETAISIIEKRKFVECLDSGEEIEKGHGRQESRRYISFPITDDFPPLSNDWEGLKSVTRVIRKRTLNNETTEEVLLFISSHPYHSENIKIAIRSHWHVENNLHWQLDVSFNEDQCRARVKNEAENIALLRRITMAYLKEHKKVKRGIKCKRKVASWDEEYMFDVLINGLKIKACKQ